MQTITKSIQKVMAPALEINPGLILTECTILPFLAQHDPKQDLIHQAWGVQRYLNGCYLNSELHDAYAVFFTGKLDRWWKNKAYAEVDRLLKYIDNYLAESECDYLVDDNFYQQMPICLSLQTGQIILNMI